MDSLMRAFASPGPGRTLMNREVARCGFCYGNGCTLSTDAESSTPMGDCTECGGPSSMDHTVCCAWSQARIAHLAAGSPGIGNLDDAIGASANARHARREVEAEESKRLFNGWGAQR